VGYWGNRGVKKKVETRPKDGGDWGGKNNIRGRCHTLTWSQHVAVLGQKKKKKKEQKNIGAMPPAKKGKTGAGP